MSNLIPIFEYPNGHQVSPPQDAVYRWIGPLGGESLPGPIPWGTIRPDGKKAHGAVLTRSIGPLGQHLVAVEYHGVINNRPSYISGNINYDAWHSLSNKPS